jgi:hypothetical protein
VPASFTALTSSTSDPECGSFHYVINDSSGSVVTNSNEPRIDDSNIDTALYF